LWEGLGDFWEGPRIFGMGRRAIWDGRGTMWDGRHWVCTISHGPLSSLRGRQLREFQFRDYAGSLGVCGVGGWRQKAGSMSFLFSSSSLGRSDRVGCAGGRHLTGYCSWRRPGVSRHGYRRPHPPAAGLAPSTRLWTCSRGASVGRGTVLPSPSFTRCVAGVTRSWGRIVLSHERAYHSLRENTVLVVHKRLPSANGASDASDVPCVPRTTSTVHAPGQ
jgi:hypothetical protein